MADENMVALDLLLSYVLKYTESVIDTEVLGDIRTLNVESIVALLKIGGVLSEEEYEKLQQALELAKSHYDSLPPVRGNTGDYQVSTTKRDFSESMKETLLNICTQIGQEPFYNIDRWDTLYSGEKWMNRINIGTYKQGIKDYYNYTETANEKTKEQIRKVFTEVAKVDRAYAQKINTSTEEINKIREEIDKI